MFREFFLVAHMFRCSWKHADDDSVKIPSVNTHSRWRHRKSAVAERKKEPLKGAGGRQVDPPIPSEYVHSCGATTRNSSWMGSTSSIREFFTWFSCIHFCFRFFWLRYCSLFIFLFLLRLLSSQRFCLCFWPEFAASAFSLILSMSSCYLFSNIDGSSSPFFCPFVFGYSTSAPPRPQVNAEGSPLTEMGEEEEHHEAGRTKCLELQERFSTKLDAQGEDTSATPKLDQARFAKTRRKSHSARLEWWQHRYRLRGWNPARVTFKKLKVAAGLDCPDVGSRRSTRTTKRAASQSAPPSGSRNRHNVTRMRRTLSRKRIRRCGSWAGSSSNKCCNSCKVT